MTNLKAGLVLILIGATCFGGWFLWYSTRTWVPLDMPVSLVPGHIRSSDFDINVESLYAIELRVKTPESDRFGCGYSSSYCLATLKTSWSLLDGERVVAAGNCEFRSSQLGYIYIRRGHYTLDLQIQEQDVDRRSVREPHLVLVEDGGLHRLSDLGGFVAFFEFLVLPPRQPASPRFSRRLSTGTRQCSASFRKGRPSRFT